MSLRGCLVGALGALVGSVVFICVYAVIESYMQGSGRNLLLTTGVIMTLSAVAYWNLVGRRIVRPKHLFMMSVLDFGLSITVWVQAPTMLFNLIGVPRNVFAAGGVVIVVFLCAILSVALIAGIVGRRNYIFT